MRFLLSKSAAALMAALFFATSLSTAQSVRPDFDRPENYDVLHYVLRVSFDPGKRIVNGETTIRFRPLVDNLDRVEFDAVDINFASVKLEIGGTTVPFKTGGGIVMVDLDRKYNRGDEISLVFKHSAKPKKGVYFVDEKLENGRVVHPAQIWTQGEPDEARHWFPLFDFPSDKATTEQIITVPKPQTVIGNGELVSVADNSDGSSTFHYKMDIPFSPYLISFVVGDYARVEDRYGEVPLSYYIYRGREAIVPLAYGKTKDMMRIFEELTGFKYPYNKYDQTVVANFEFGGMENITATTMADSEIAYANFDFLRGGVEDLVAHELAHSWFGNLVTCKNWAELWLNEGFATFMEAAVREKMYGRKEYMRKILLDAEIFKTDDALGKKRFGLFNLEAGNVAALFDRPAITYNKGGAVVHQLREQVGEEAFWRGINQYLDRHKFENVETPDLQAVMEDASGQKLGWFFEQWVYGIGYPKLTVTPKYHAPSKTLRLTITQTQTAGKNMPAAYRLPIQVDVRAASGGVTKRIEITKRNEVFQIPVKGKPTEVKLDPAEKIPLKSVKLLTIK